MQVDFISLGRKERRMFELLKKRKVACRQFLDDLESLQRGKNSETRPEDLLASMPEPAREHAGQCPGCQDALSHFAATRTVLCSLAVAPPEAGPWFTSRVMKAIAARENELEQRDGVWVSVRKLAPRLVAFCVLLLVLGGTWAYQLRRTDLSQHVSALSGESIFEAAPTPLNDDVLAATPEVHP
jgi:hypothetical protein